ncbi:MAG: MarR family transcriptional regulator [Proteobacteria bacterium]|nr:MarR family transcriptional regulator [Pseudomonadota bacterium]
MTKPQRNDHVARLIAQRRAATPDVPLDGMEVLARARRLTLLSRAPIEAVFARHGLDTGEFDVLATLRRSDKPSVRPTELYQDLMISSGGLTDRLRRLEQSGWIERIDSEEDKRSKRVRLTEAGRNLIDRAFADDMIVERDLLSSLDGDSREQLADLLAKLLTAIEG